MTKYDPHESDDQRRMREHHDRIASSIRESQQRAAEFNAREEAMHQPPCSDCARKDELLRKAMSEMNKKEFDTSTTVITNCGCSDCARKNELLKRARKRIHSAMSLLGVVVEVQALLAEIDKELEDK